MPAPWNMEPLEATMMSEEVVTNSGDGSNLSNLSKLITITKVPMRPTPIVHPAVDAPICPECQALEMTFFSPECAGCREELVKMSHHGIGVASIMAILRQWVPQVQQGIAFLIDTALALGAHPDDRDSVTDMTLLMFTCKAGAAGVGDGAAASKVARHLIDLGASLKIRCRWTNMAPLHYAAYFDVGPVLNDLLMASKGVDVDTVCCEYDNGTALHIAAANLAVSSVRVLLSFGADASLRDDLARRPVDCIPEMHSIDVTLPTDDVEDMVAKLKMLLTKGITATTAAAEAEFESGFMGASSMSINSKGLAKMVTGRSVMNALGLKIGDRVFVNGNKIGTLYFCGTTEFAGGIWAGIALDQPDGKNDGTVKGVTYFSCVPDHGVFVPPNKIAKVGRNYRDPGENERSSYAMTAMRPPILRVNHGKVDVSKVAPRIHEAMNNIAEKGNAEIRVGDRVNVTDLDDGVSGKKTSCYGTVRFVGRVDFVAGDNKWFGVELDQALGRHDGTVQDVRYFAAPDDHGVFVTESKLTKIANNTPKKPVPADEFAEDEINTFSMNYHTLNNEPDSVEDINEAASVNTMEPDSLNNREDRSRSKSPKTTKGRPLRRSLSMQHRASKANGGSQNSIAQRGPTSSVMSNSAYLDRRPSPGPSSIMSLSTPGVIRRKKSSSLSSDQDPSSASGGWKSVGAVQPNKFQMKRSPKKKFIDIGMTVICIHNKEMGVVKYVGRSDLGPGIWIGLELRNPRGRHDGLVGGRRYFQSKAGHGVMLRPKMVSVHGINGEDLLKPESEYPF